MSLKSAPNTSAVKRQTSVSGSFQAAAARPALCAQQYERESSLDQPVSPVKSDKFQGQACPRRKVSPRESGVEGMPLRHMGST